MKRTTLAVAVLFTLVGCATLVNDPMTPVSLTLSDGSPGNCTLKNKRGIWSTAVPASVYVRRSDDALIIECTADDGRKGVGSIASEMGAEIVASAVFFDLGITDAITDKHRHYSASYVVPIAPKAAE